MMTRAQALLGCGLLATLLGGALSAHAAAPAHKRAGGPTVRAAANSSRTTVDWSDYTYTSACFSDHPRQFVARNGLAMISGTHFQVYTPIYGDITGDGRPEAIVPYSCTGADFGGVHVFVYTSTAGQPRLLGEIPSATAGSGTGTSAPPSIASVNTVTLPALTALPAQRVLQISGTGYSANALHSCPDLTITSRYRVTRNRLIDAGSTVQRSSRCLTS